MKKYYRQIIIGATFFGCGLALREKDTLILEPSILAGGDFTLNFDPGTDWDYQPCNPGAAEFLHELRERDVLRGGRIRQGALTPVFSHWCLKHKLDIALWHDVLEIGKNSVTVHNVEGKFTIESPCIVDARPQTGDFKYLTAAILLENPVTDGSYGEFELTNSLNEREAYLMMRLPAACEWPEARQKFHQAWQGRDRESIKGSLMAIGPRFSYRNYSNPVAALDGGESCTM